VVDAVGVGAAAGGDEAPFDDAPFDEDDGAGNAPPVSPVDAGDAEVDGPEPLCWPGTPVVPVIPVIPVICDGGDWPFDVHPSR
jgi:hypothetical protein